MIDKDLDEIVDKLIAEAFYEGGNRRNITHQGNDKDMQKKMVTGDWFGSSAWPFDMPSNKEIEKSNELYANPLGESDELVDEFVNKLLEDSPSHIYTDVDSVGYLLNTLESVGYKEFSDRIQEILENPTQESPKEIYTMVEKLKGLEESSFNNFLVEQLANLGLGIAMAIEGENEE